MSQPRPHHLKESWSHLLGSLLFLFSTQSIDMISLQSLGDGRKMKVSHDHLGKDSHAFQLAAKNDIMEYPKHQAAFKVFHGELTLKVFGGQQ